MIRHPLMAGLAAAALLATGAPAAHAAGFQTVLDRAVGPDLPGVTLYVHRPGHRDWSGAAGRADVRAGTPMRPADRFRAGSIIKPFVAVATLRLVEQGRLRLDDPLPAVLPADVVARFPEAGRITVRMLLDHTSGIGDYVTPAFEREVAVHPRRRWSVGELLDRAAALPRAFPPGAGFAYSNTDYNLLGLVLEHVTGRPWRAVVRAAVIAPLHLRHTSLPAPGTRPAGRDIAHGYETVDGRTYDLTDVDPSMAGAAGGQALLTNAADLTRFERALRAGRLFHRRDTLREMRAFVPTQDEHGLSGYGLGLERYTLPGGVQMVGHMGTAAGYRALMFHVPHADFTLAFNSTGDPTPALVSLLGVLRGA